MFLQKHQLTFNLLYPRIQNYSLYVRVSIVLFMLFLLSQERTLSSALRFATGTYSDPDEYSMDSMLYDTLYYHHY
jgi:hypothetical protein